MVKLNNNEINDALELDDGKIIPESKGSSLIETYKINQENASMKWQFVIEEPMKNVVEEIMPRVKKSRNGEYVFVGDNDVLSFVDTGKDTISIESGQTAFRGISVTANKNGKGSTVEVSGALPFPFDVYAGFSPSWHYVSGTLQGKVMDLHGEKDVTPYLNPEECGAIIKEFFDKNKYPSGHQTDFDEAKFALDDKYNRGRLEDLNKFFKNEISILPDYKTKNEKAQKDFENGRKFEGTRLERAKARVKSHIEQNKAMTADIKEGMAKTKESGYKHISRTPSLNKGGREE